MREQTDGVVKTEAKPTPAHEVQRDSNKLTLEDRVSLLAWAESRARQKGDEEMLREIAEWRLRQQL